MKKALVIITLLLVMSGCVSNNQTTKKNQYRVISLAPNITENFIGIEKSDILVAVDTFSDFEQTKNLPKFDAANLNLEEVLSLNPTHIVIYDYNSQSTKGDLEQFIASNNKEIDVITVKNAQSIQDIYDNIIDVGKVFGFDKESEKLVNYMKDEIATIKKEAAKKSAKNVYIEVSGEPYITTTGSETFLNEMIEVANGKNIFNDQTGWFSPSIENIIELNPDVIISNDINPKKHIKEIKNRNGFAKIDAVANNQVKRVDTNSTSRASYKIVDGIKELVKVIHDEE